MTDVPKGEEDPGRVVSSHPVHTPPRIPPLQVHDAEHLAGGGQGRGPRKVRRHRSGDHFHGHSRAQPGHSRVG
eukprot:9432934-Pyramimonas_sp.AAC.1